MFRFVAEKIESEPVYYKDGVMVGSDAATEDSGDWQLEAQIDDEEIGDGGDDENSEQGHKLIYFQWHTVATGGSEVIGFEKNSTYHGWS